ncbi:imelysin family protein [Prosthecodimorpha staleyi]|uniref:Peptidase n=1 Tax=Prosthecodimorpha staleyi TaxID=2840188 RepID=A0A947D8D2_9HYPH|nr:imelysin family protein [Prosthecodimorpha staleyi]MBT9292585.1 peptidase [Prosthecodimorpha staleyi]
MVRIPSLALAAFLVAGSASAPALAGPAPEAEAVIGTYAQIGQAAFEDAFLAGKSVKAAVDAFLADPTEAKLAAARQAWKDARPWYQHTETFRFGNKIVDDWEGKVNAWPLDEGLIDYVDTSVYGESSDENPLFRANVVGSTSVRIGKTKVDVRKITKKLLSEKLQEAGGVEANVATGWHAVEFLLWGQDLNGTGPGAGNRPASDYALKGCTHDHCDRRRAYLSTVTDLLVDDLAEMAAAWKPNGAARKALAARKAGGLGALVTGIGSLSYGELAGERMKLGVLLHDPEEEHDCFSDNTHNSHYHDQVGMMSIYTGRYARRDGSVVEGPGFAAFAAAKSPEKAARLDAAMKTTLERLDAIRTKAETGGMAYDQMLASGNDEGNKLILDAVDGLVAQTHALEAVVADLGIDLKLNDSKSLSDPGSVAKK